MTKPRLIIALLALLALPTRAGHDFYVSVTSVEYNPGSRTLQVIVQLFPDDLEDALEEFVGKKIRVAGEEDRAGADSILSAYMQEKFALESDGRSLELEFIGAEYEEDMIHVFVESEELDAPETLRVRNSVLMERFSSQVNIVHCTVNGKRRSLYFKEVGEYKELKF